MSLRDQWREEHHVSWSDSVFDSVERFVREQPDENIEEFVETEELEDLFSGMMPNPKPIAHRDYMVAFAEKYLNGDIED